MKRYTSDLMTAFFGCIMFLLLLSGCLSSRPSTSTSRDINSAVDSSALHTVLQEARHGSPCPLPFIRTAITSPWAMTVVRYSCGPGKDHYPEAVPSRTASRRNHMQRVFQLTVPRLSWEAVSANFIFSTPTEPPAKASQFTV